MENGGRRWRGPYVLVAVVIIFNLWTLRAEGRSVQQLNDSSIHASMTRWAADRIHEGHLPLDGWYPYLSLGASRFHHYQSLPHVVTGAASVVFGPRTFALSLYLLLSLWPIAVYLGARLFDLDPWAAGVAALVSPLLVSAPGLGYEAGSYTWQGYGAWTQLWGMWLLPFAWGLGWRAVARGRSVAAAALVMALTVAVNLITGYLALVSLAVWVLVRPAELLRRSGRAAVLAAGALLTASWVLVPLVADARWAAQDEFSRGRFFYDSFGARRVLGWLLTGRLFDEGRLAVITVLVGVGLAVSARRLARDERTRAVLGVGLLSLVLFFGRPTLGPLVGLLPGGEDLFLRRFIIGVHLAGILLAGIGGAWLAGFVVGRLKGLSVTKRPEVAVATVAVLGLLLLAPAWLQRASYHARGAGWIDEQQAADSLEGADVAALVARAQSLGGGRVYGGLLGGWGDGYRVGFVPVYAVLLNNDADAIGFPRPTWSLMSNAESRFDDSNLAQYDLLGIRYLVLPAGSQPPIPATRVEQRGGNVLWQLPQVGYVDVVDTRGVIEADRTRMGSAMAGFLTSPQLGEGVFPTVAFAGLPAAPSTLPAGLASTGGPGNLIGETSRPEEGWFATRVSIDRVGMVVLKASFDPRWRVTVDGVEVSPQMVAPALVGRIVPPGEHTVVFRYQPYPAYSLLLGIGAATLAALQFGPRLASRARRRRAALRPGILEPEGIRA
jgi:hypothetical protein